MTTAAAFKEWIQSDAPFELAGADTKTASQPCVPHHFGALMGYLDAVCGGAGARRSFLRYCFGVSSGKDLHVRAINALYYWLAVRPDADGKWAVTNPKAQATAAAVVAAALVEAGQMELKL